MTVVVLAIVVAAAAAANDGYVAVTLATWRRRINFNLLCSAAVSAHLHLHTIYAGTLQVDRQAKMFAPRSNAQLASCHINY